MITAIEAKKMASEKIKKQEEKLLKKIEKEVKKSAKKGRFASRNINVVISDETVEKLEKLGYSVTVAKIGGYTSVYYYKDGE